MNQKWTFPLTAVVLATLTLSVFAMLQNYGPESTLRHFFELISSRDKEGLDRILAPSGRSADNLNPQEAALVREVSYIATANGEYRILRLRRSSRYSEALVEYDLPDGASRLTTWVIKRPVNRWTVDLAATAALRFNSPF